VTPRRVRGGGERGARCSALSEQASFGEADDCVAGDDQVVRGAWLRGRGSAASGARRRLSAFCLVTGLRPCASTERRALLAGRRSRDDPDRAVSLLTRMSTSALSVVRVHRRPRSANGERGRSSRLTECQAVRENAEAVTPRQVRSGRERGGLCSAGSEQASLREGHNRVTRDHKVVQNPHVY
jgi:hypothetical protein